jgi:phosphoribosylglycinamide formyltransferase 1
MEPVRIVVVVSGQARLVDVGLRHDALIRAQVQSVVSDRACPAEKMARSHGVVVTRIEESDNRDFSDALLSHCESISADYIVLLFNRLLRGPLLERYRHRIVNFHPSLLPAFKGLHAVDDALSSGVRFIGTTVHFIDEQMDQGHIILQTIQPRDPSSSRAEVADRQFEHMCKAFVQVCHWIQEDRLRVGRAAVEVVGAGFHDLEFSPALDAPEAAGLLAQGPTPDR